MAVTLEYSTDRGSTWTALSRYTHPTTAGISHERIPIASLVRLGKPLRFRLTGTDAASWGLYDWKLEAPVTPKKERILV